MHAQYAAPLAHSPDLNKLCCTRGNTYMFRFVRAQTLKIIRYTSRLVAATTPKGSDINARFSALEKSIGVSRKVWKLLYHAQLLESNVTATFIQVIRYITLHISRLLHFLIAKYACIFYFACRRIVWASKYWCVVWAPFSLPHNLSDLTANSICRLLDGRVRKQLSAGCN